MGFHPPGAWVSVLWEELERGLGALGAQALANVWWATCKLELLPPWWVRGRGRGSKDRGKPSKDADVASHGASGCWCGGTEERGEVWGGCCMKGTEEHSTHDCHGESDARQVTEGTKQGCMPM